MHLRTITTLAAATAAAALAATPALAGPDNGNGARQPLSGFGDVVVATCADGGTVSGPLDGSIVRHSRYDQDGNLVRLTLNMEYKMTWTLSTTGESVYPHGTRHIVLNFADGISTDSGNFRTLTATGEGAVLKWAGRTVEDLETEELISKVGPAVAESDDLVCGLFGLEGA
jgi:hypothetical protein